MLESLVIEMNNTIDVDELQYSSEYAEYIMTHGDRPCYNGSMLLELMEQGYLFSAFLESINEDDE